MADTWRNARHPILVTDADVAFFAEHGYLIYRHQLFPQEKFRRLQAFFDRLLAQLPRHARPEGMDTPHFAFPELFEWLAAREVLDFVEHLIGPNIVLWASHFLCKMPKRGLAVPWHEDSAYWNNVLSEHKAVTVWLAIDDSLPENGCMRVIPGTHRGGFSDYEEVDARRHVFGTQIRPDQLDESAAVDLAIKAGECHVHHARLMHGSSPNTSGKRRCGYTMRYMPSDVRHYPERQQSGHAVYLLRGRDLAGNTYADPEKVFEPGMLRWKGAGA
jgi:chlorinating enzyme